jgi:hypothetical protein
MKQPRAEINNTSNVIRRSKTAMLIPSCSIPPWYVGKDLANTAIHISTPIEAIVERTNSTANGMPHRTRANMRVLPVNPKKTIPVEVAIAGIAVIANTGSYPIPPPISSMIASAINGIFSTQHNKLKPNITIQRRGRRSDGARRIGVTASEEAYGLELLTGERALYLDNGGGVEERMMGRLESRNYSDLIGVSQE